MKSLQESIGSVRGLCQNLGPEDLEDLGLTKALHFLVENFARVKKLAWQTELDDITH